MASKDDVKITSLFHVVAIRHRVVDHPSTAGQWSQGLHHRRRQEVSNPMVNQYGVGLVFYGGLSRRNDVRHLEDEAANK